MGFIEPSSICPPLRRGLNPLPHGTITSFFLGPLLLEVPPGTPQPLPSEFPTAPTPLPRSRLISFLDSREDCVSLSTGRLVYLNEADLPHSSPPIAATSTPLLGCSPTAPPPFLRNMGGEKLRYLKRSVGCLNNVAARPI